MTAQNEAKPIPGIDWKARRVEDQIQITGEIRVGDTYYSLVVFALDASQLAVRVAPRSDGGVQILGELEFPDGTYPILKAILNTGDLEARTAPLDA